MNIGVDVDVLHAGLIAARCRRSGRRIVGAIQLGVDAIGATGASVRGEGVGVALQFVVLLGAHRIARGAVAPVGTTGSIWIHSGAIIGVPLHIAAIVGNIEGCGAVPAAIGLAEIGKKARVRGAGNGLAVAAQPKAVWRGQRELAQQAHWQQIRGQITL